MCVSYLTKSVVYCTEAIKTIVVLVVVTVNIVKEARIRKTIIIIIKATKENDKVFIKI